MVALAILGTISIYFPEAEGATVWSTNQNLTSNWTVAAGDKLIIEPGVIVSLDADVSIFVEGTLEAIGTSSQPIIFSPSAPGITWGSILFNRTSINNVIDHAVIDNATTGLSINGSNPAVNHVTITSSSLYGIHMVDSSPIISNSTISASGTFDIYVESQAGSTPIALNTSFDKGSVNVVGAGSSLEVQWYLDVEVMDTYENPIQDAEVFVKNSSQELVFQGFSDIQGLASRIICTEFINYSGSRVYQTPHNITVTKEGYSTAFAFPEPFIGSSVGTTVMIMDNIPPTTTIAVGSPNVKGIPMLVASSTNFTFNVEEKGSGVALTEYQIDNNGWMQYMLPFNITSPRHHNITYKSKDNAGNEEIEEKLWIYVDTPPTIALTTISNATANSLFQYQIKATDIDEMDTITFTLDAGPDGMVMNATTGMISWLPKDVQVGMHIFVVNITDGLSFVTQEFTIIVKLPIPTKNPLLDNLWLISIIVIVAVIFGTLGATEYGKYGAIKFLFLPLYTKLKKEKLLDQFTRGKIFGYILANPGEHYSSIKRILGLNNGQLTYHLSVLEREGMIKSRIDSRFKRFYPAEKVEPAINSSDLLSTTQKYIYEIIRKNIGISQKEIAETLGESKQVVNYHIKLLESRGLIRVEYDGNYTRCFVKK